jgi:hypothetical protein
VKVGTEKTGFAPWVKRRIPRLLAERRLGWKQDIFGTRLDAVAAFVAQLDEVAFGRGIWRAQKAPGRIEWGWSGACLYFAFNADSLSGDAPEKLCALQKPLAPGYGVYVFIHSLILPYDGSFITKTEVGP